MKFKFKAKTKTGGIKEGTIETANKEAAIDILQRNELFPLAVAEEKGADLFTKTFFKYYDRVTDKELVVFFRQLATLIEAKVPLVSSLTAINDQTANKYFHKVIKEAINDIEDGLPFSDAISKHKDVFSVLSVNIIKAGETSGNLKSSIEYVANNIEKNYELTSRIKSAMMYPAIVLIVFFIIGFLVITIILPKLTQIIKDMDVDVPWYTKIVIAVGDFMSSYWWAVALIIIGFIVSVIYYLRTEKGKKEWDQIKIKLPVVGVIFRNIYISRFSENLSALLSSGIPIIRALKIVSSVVNNVVFEAVILKAAEEVKIGGNMSNVLGKSELIPPLVAHMLKIGEESGQVDKVLVYVSKFYERETDTMTKNLSTLIEPVLMIIIGIAVGFMAVSILMPIYNIAGQIK